MVAFVYTNMFSTVCIFLLKASGITSVYYKRNGYTRSHSRELCCKALYTLNLWPNQYMYVSFQNWIASSNKKNG